MNKRIKELAEQAGYLPDSFGIGHWDMPECKKFAELIIQEAASLTLNYKNESYYNGWLDYRDEIKRHFGIKYEQ